MGVTTQDGVIYKILSRGEWDVALRDGVYRGSAADRRDGFIHFSTRGQVAGTLARHFAGQSQLLRVAFDARALGGALRYEPAHDGQLFPHLYGELPTGLALEVVEIGLSCRSSPSNDDHTFLCESGSSMRRAPPEDEESRSR